MNTEAEIEVMRLGATQGQDCQQSPEAGRGKQALSTRALRGNSALLGSSGNSPGLSPLASELCENTFLLF